VSAVITVAPIGPIASKADNPELPTQPEEIAEAVPPGISRRPWHFADEVVTDECQLPARQGECNACVLAELGLTPAEMAALNDSALVQHEQRTEAVSAGLSNTQGEESR
jgi:hypothetical protein